MLAQQSLPTIQAVKSGATGNEVVLPDPGTVYQLGTLPGLAVPNTLPAGVPGAGQAFAVTAAAVNSAIQTGQVQYYSFQATAGELMAFQVISATNTLNTHPILPALEVLDANGNLVSYAGNNTTTAFYGAGAVNQHEFESNDSTLFDVTLPAAGTYYVGVTTLPISPAGNYQLFMYSFGTDPSAAGDTLIAGSGTGNDTVLGSSGNDSFGFAPGFAGQAAVYTGSGPYNTDVSNVATPWPQHVQIYDQSSGLHMAVSSSSASNPISYGSAVTLTATVTAQGGTTPTGTVTFYSNGTLLGSQTLSGGSASLTSSALQGGTDTITAAYSSGSNLLVNSANTTTVSVTAIPTETSVSSSTATGIFGQSLTFTATVTASPSNALVPTGSVGFFDTTTKTDLGRSTLSANGTATLTTSALAVGSQTITVSYAGNANFLASSAPAFTQAVGQAQPAFSGLTASQAIAYGTPSITLSGHLAPNAGQQTISAGETVTATIGGLTQSAALDANDHFTMTFDTHTLAPSATPYTITYRYTADTDYLSASDSSTTLTVNPVSILLTVPSSTVTSDFGQPLTLSATVTAKAPSNATPAGSVDFYDTTTQVDLGTVSLSANGTASLTTATLPVGPQTITVSYAASSNFLAASTSVSATIVESIYTLNSSLSGDLSVSGNASVNIAGLIQVDSKSSTALQASGSATVSASAIHVVGGVQTSGSATLSVKPVTGSASVFDPEAALTVPTGGTKQNSVNLGGSQTLTINPGIYGQISVSGNAKLTMNPGVYVLAGGGFTVTGNGSVTGSGVMLYNAGSNYTTTGSGGNFGGITLGGNGTVSLTAPTTGIYAGVLIFQERDNNRAIALSGSGVASLNGGLIYAPQALLNVSGNAQVKHSPLIVAQLQVSGNGSSTLTNGSDSTNNTAGQLLAGNLSMYVDNSNGYFTSDELARIQDVITNTNTLLVPYGVTVAEVNDPSLANITIDSNTTSPVGGMADGVLGCFTVDTGEITLIQGWNWYAGSDPTAIAAGQYSFTTTVTHEIGHALGLGGSSDPNSPMFESLPTGVVKGGLTVADLALPPLDTTYADALNAALTDIASAGSFSRDPKGGALPFGSRLNEPMAPVSASSPFTNGIGWVANWAWLALGLGESRDPNPPTSAVVSDSFAGGTGNGILPRSPAASLTVTGLGGNRNGIRPTNDLSTKDDRTTWDESNDSEGADETTTLEDRSDPAVLDQFFRKIGGGEGEGGAVAE